MNSRNARISSGPEHLRQQRGASLSVAMFAAERPAELQHQIGGAFNELAEFAQSLLGAKVEVDAHVYAALAIVAVERTAISVLGHQLVMPRR